jgi:hypothetical protein
LRFAGALIGTALALAWLWPPSARFAPPALFEAGPRVGDYSLEPFPAGTEKVSVELAGGERLRGVFVPSDPGAPVVLHLLESSGSITSPFWFAGYGSLLADLADLGFASLALDYRGRRDRRAGSRSRPRLRVARARLPRHRGVRRVALGDAPL